MLHAFTKGCTKMVEKFLPDAYLFAAILSIVCFILALLLTPSSPMDVLMAWGGGMWNLLAFTAEMATIMVFHLGIAYFLGAPFFSRSRFMSFCMGRHTAPVSTAAAMASGTPLAATTPIIRPNTASTPTPLRAA